MKSRKADCLTAKERKAMNQEIHKQLSKAADEHFLNMDAAVLYVLWLKFGFGPKRLMRFHKAFRSQIKELKDFYESQTDETASYCTQILKNRGIDVEAWNCGDYGEVEK